MSLQDLLKNVREKFAFLFDKYDFKITHTYERLYPVNIKIGLESVKYPYIKILFIHEWATSVMIGSRDASFEDDTGWFSMRRIVDFRLKRSMRWPPSKIDTPYEQYLLIDLSHSAIELKEHWGIFFEMFSDGNQINKWAADFKKYVATNVRRRFSQSKD